MFESLRKKQKLCDVNQTIVFLGLQLFIRAYNEVVAADTACSLAAPYYDGASYTSYDG